MHRLIITVSLLLLPEVARGCQCGSRPSALEAVPISSEVFEGTVLRRVPFLSRVEGSFTVLERIDFIVHQAWRGSNDGRRTLVTGYGNCDFLFEAGTRYLVFAVPYNWHPPSLGSSICLPTTSTREASQALSDLGPGLSFSDVAPSTPESRLARYLRISRSSFLWGVATSVSAVSRPEYMPSPALAHALPGPLAIVVSVGASVFLSLRRRFRLLVAALPLHASVVVLAFVVQGYLRILSWPPLSFWILNRLYGA
jgi:hypothetical protein